MWEGGNIAAALLHEQLQLANQLMEGNGLDLSMTLSPTERVRALEIKQAVEQEDDLQNLTDMEYAHYALATDSLREALQKIQGIQTFRQHYGIDDSIEQGVYYMQEALKQQPGYFLHMDMDPTTYEALFVIDMGAFFPERTMQIHATKGADHNFEVDVCKNYYGHFSLCPTLSSIRQGIFGIMDCHEMGWANFSTDYAQRYRSELSQYLPLKWKTLLCYNTATLANVCFSLMKPFMDEGINNTLQLGLQLECFDDDTTMQTRELKELYLQPNLEVAHEKILTKFTKMWTLRQKNKEQFRL